MIEKTGKKSLASECRHRINIQTLSSVSDGEGGFTTAYTDGSNYWAAIYPMSAAQVKEYRTINVNADYLIKIRGNITVAEKTNRIRFGARYFEVLTVMDLQERGIVKHVACKEER
jgi:SPP1 family predicted phage head-tail adaptor